MTDSSDDTDRQSIWRRFVAHHFADYTPAAMRLWLVLTTLGAAAATASLLHLGSLPNAARTEIQLGIVFVLVAGFFVIQVPRTKYSISIADVFLFTLLAVHGAAPAAIAAGAEGAVAAWRNSRRLSSRISTPAVATLAMLGAGLVFEHAAALLAAAGLAAPAARVAALAIATLPYFAIGSLPLLAVVALKNGRPIQLLAWARDYSWLPAIYLVSAFAAGILVTNVDQFGRALIPVTGAVALVAVVLIRHTLERTERERRGHEERTAQAEAQAAVSRQQFSAAFTHAAIGMALVGEDGRIARTNQALCELLGRSSASLVGAVFSTVLDPADAEVFQRRCLAAFDSAGSGASQAGADTFAIELRCRGSDGLRWVSLHSSRFDDTLGNGGGLIHQLLDITGRREAEGQLQYIAYHDTVTNLANRNCFNERLGAAVERSRTDANSSFAVLFLDLDRFKVVNDCLGHLAGNQVLREVGSRLAAQLRPCDLVARLGGDEFAILVDGVDSPAIVHAAAARCLAALSRPLSVNGTEVVPGASIGMTFSDMGYRSVDEVLRDADLAMYEAKANGRQRIVAFESRMHDRVAEKLKLESELRRAIGGGQLSLMFQPLFNLDPQRLEGFEALVRWIHPERGPVSPEVFVTLAEETGCIAALTAWVVEEAVAQLARLHAAYPEHAELGMHVNISGNDLSSDTIVGHVDRVLRLHKVAPRHVTLEITETTLMSKLDVALDTLRKLRALGVSFSIDDFGTGYSSLAYLSTLPIDSLKIDRSFVMELGERPENVEIVRAVLTLGRSLGKKVIAEGIETIEQLRTLKSLGVPVGQGYLLSRPLRPEQVDLLLEAGIALAA